MKKRILFLMALAVLCCLFAVNAFAAEPSTSDEFGEVTIITDSAKISARNDYGYAEGEDCRVVLQIPDTQTYITYPMYYCFGVRNDGQYGMQPTPDFANLNEATGYNFTITSVIRLEIPNYFTAVSTNYTQTNQMANLKYIKLNENFIYIHSSAFSRLANLETVEFEENNSGEVSFSISSKAFEFSSIKNIVLPSQVTYIGERCFEGSALESITFGARVEATGTAAFIDCKSLKTVIVPENNSLVTVSHRSFENCQSLTGEINFSNVTFIDSKAFYKCATNEDTYLVLRFPSIVNVGSSGDNHIFTDSGVAEIYYGPNIAKMTLNNYNNCKRLTVIEMAGVAEGFGFSSYTFRDCTALKSFCIPEGVTALPEKMFENCSSLGAVYLPSTLTAIKSRDNSFATFYRCTSLYFVNEPFTSDNIPEEPEIYFFPSGLTEVWSEAFDGSRLNEVLVFPAGVTELTSGYTFEGCTSKSGTPTVVFLGDMTSVVIRTWGVSKVYFCNPADVDAASAGASNDSRLVFCFAEGNTSHIKAQSKSTEATCELPKMVADYCFCGQFIPGTETTEGTPLGHNYTGAISYAFTTVYENGEKCTVCLNNCGKDLVEVLATVYTELGFSASTFGERYSVTNGYKIDRQSLALYEEAKGVTVKLGFAFNAAEGFTDGEVTLDSFKLKAEVNNQYNGVAFDYHDFIISYSDNTHLNDNIIVAAYVVEKGQDGETVYFINRSYEDGVNGFEAVSYSSIVNK